MTVGIGHNDALRMEALWGEAHTHGDETAGHFLRVRINNMGHPGDCLEVEVIALDSYDPILGHRKILLLDAPDSQNTVIRVWGDVKKRSGPGREPGKDTYRVWP